MKFITNEMWDRGRDKWYLGYHKLDNWTSDDDVGWW
jgi:hypothetical protein